MNEQSLSSDELPEQVEYAGFWARCGATLVDTVILLLITMPLTMVIYGNSMWASGTKQILGGWDIVINWVFPAIAVVLFWHFKGATPGKMIVTMKVVDQKTGLKPSFTQSIIRYFSYFVSIIPLFLGFFWIAVDKKKQGWHDKLAGTVVVRIRK